MRPIFDKKDRNPVAINHEETVQIAVNWFLKHSEETGPISECTFYLAVSMSLDATVPLTLIFHILNIVSIFSNRLPLDKRLAFCLNNCVTLRSFVHKRFAFVQHAATHCNILRCLSLSSFPLALQVALPFYICLSSKRAERLAGASAKVFARCSGHSLSFCAFRVYIV